MCKRPQERVGESSSIENMCSCPEGNQQEKKAEMRSKRKARPVLQPPSAEPDTDVSFVYTFAQQDFKTCTSGWLHKFGCLEGDDLL